MAEKDDVYDITIDPLDDEGGEVAPEQKLKLLRDKLKKAEAEASENLAGWQRAKADYINLQKRMRELESELGRAGTVAAVTGFLDVFDSVEAAEMPQVIKQLDSALSRHNILRFRPEAGEPFDPNRHEAVSIVATNEKTQDNVIHSVLQSGYSLEGTTIIRPARVTVFHYE